MFREGQSEEQREQMIMAFIEARRSGFTYQEVTSAISSVRTAFFQPSSELAALALLKLSHKFNPPAYGWDCFRTPKDNLEERLTYKYQNGYSYLDEYEHKGKAEELSCEELNPENDWADESRKWKRVYRVISCDDYYNLYALFKEIFTGSSCTHDYDCCGCWHYHVTSIEEIKLGNTPLYEVIVSGSRNY